MGGVWSYTLCELDGSPSHMRLASREVCDDETWANTVLNRSACSVQERLSELELSLWDVGGDGESEGSGSESDDEMPGRRRKRKSIEWSQTDMVREFVVEECVGKGAEGDERPLAGAQEEELGGFGVGVLVDFDPW